MTAARAGPDTRDFDQKGEGRMAFPQSFSGPRNAGRIATRSLPGPPAGRQGA